MQGRWQREGTYLTQMSFTCIKVTKGFVICNHGEEGHNHPQSFTNASRQGHIVVKVLALRYKNILEICRVLHQTMKTICKIHKHCLVPLMS